MMRGTMDRGVAVAVGGILLAMLAGCVDGSSPSGEMRTPQAESVSFAAYARTLELEPEADVSANVAIGDVEGDGDLDVVLVKGRHWPGMSRVFLGDGRGGFPTVYDLTSDPYRSYSASLVDLDGDGALDVVLSNDAPDPKLILVNDGKGGFRRASSFGEASWPTRNAAVADFNGDGHTDVVAANRALLPSPLGAPGAYVCLNQGGARFDAACEPMAEYSTTTILPVDLDGDGRVDLVVPSRDGGQGYAYLNGGHPMFSPTQRVPFGLPLATARMAGVGDFDEDGLQDIVLIDEARRAVEIYYGRSGGEFDLLPAPLDTPQAVPYALLVGDLDGDGHADVLVGFVGAPSVAFFGDGAGSFTPLEFGDGNGTVYGFAVADLDGDGHIDIVAARSGGTSVVYFGGTRDLPP